jgi:hypothetical protein
MDDQAKGSRKSKHCRKRVREKVALLMVLLLLHDVLLAGMGSTYEERGAKGKGGCTMKERKEIGFQNSRIGSNLLGLRAYRDMEP